MSLKIAVSSYSGYGAWLVGRLLSEGHKVDYYLSQKEYANILGGLIPPPRIVDGAGLYKSIKYDRYDVSLFDITGKQRQAEYSASLCPTIGDGIFNCSLEDDRRFGIEVMEQCGIKVPPYMEFTEIESAKALVRKTGKRYVFKPNGGQDQDTACTYVAHSAEDMLKYIDDVFVESHGKPFILQEFVPGTEVSVEGWFNGQDFYLLNYTLEEKKFMNDNIGPNTGCAGNLVSIFAGEPKVYKEGLAKMTEYLRSINYVGMMDLNSIVTTGDLYGLEFTPRFGYDAFSTLSTLYAGNLGEMFYRVASGAIPEQSWRSEYAAGIRISIPPYPTEIRGKHPCGVPVEGVDDEDFNTTFMYDIECSEEGLVTAGHSGFLLTPICYANTIDEAFDAVEKRVDRIKIPQSQYRTDLYRCIRKRYCKLDVDGWLR